MRLSATSQNPFASCVHYSSIKRPLCIHSQDLPYRICVESYTRPACKQGVWGNFGNIAPHDRLALGEYEAVLFSQASEGLYQVKREPRSRVLICTEQWTERLSFKVETDTSWFPCETPGSVCIHKMLPSSTPCSCCPNIVKFACSSRSTVCILGLASRRISFSRFFESLVISQEHGSIGKDERPNAVVVLNF